jgi:hypothetical protein
MQTIKTVRIVSQISEQNPNGYIVINESDLNEDHKLFVDAETLSQARKQSRRKAGE